MSYRRMKWGLIGASDIAATRMIPALRSVGHQVVGVASGSADHVQDYARKHDIEFATAELDALLCREDVEAVYISSRNVKHFEHTIRAAAAGKHVLCEKPMALRVPEAREMITACEQAGVLLAVNHHLPGAGIHRKIRELVTAGAIGRPLGARVSHVAMLPERLRGWRVSNDPGSGVVWDITCHDASVLNSLLGQAESVVCQKAIQAASPGCDAAMTSLRYADNVLAQTYDAFNVAYSQTSLEVHGTDGSIRAMNVMTQDPVGDIELCDRSGRREIEVEDRRDLYEIVLDDFVTAISDGRGLAIDGEAGLGAVAVAAAAEVSAETMRHVVIKDL